MAPAVPGGARIATAAFSGQDGGGGGTAAAGGSVEADHGF